jgi:biotin transport system substrate-specific component
MATLLAKPNILVAALLPESPADRRIAYAALALAGTVVLYASAKVQVPFFPVPMTLQTLAIMLVAAAYGFRLGVATILLYLAEAAVGIPVLAGTPEKGIGLIYMMGSTGGYLVGFVIATALVGWFAERGFDRSIPRLFVVMLAADAIVLAVGFAWLATLIGPEKAWTFGVVPFLLGDALKIAIAAALVPAANKTFRRT